LVYRRGDVDKHASPNPALGSRQLRFQFLDYSFLVAENLAVRRPILCQSRNQFGFIDFDALHGSPFSVTFLSVFHAVAQWLVTAVTAIGDVTALPPDCSHVLRKGRREFGRARCSGRFWCFYMLI
jgi:hypothetical protein